MHYYFTCKTISELLLTLNLLLFFTACGQEFVAAPEPDRGFQLPKENDGTDNEKKPEWPSKTCDVKDVELFRNSVEFSNIWRACAIDNSGKKDGTIGCLRSYSNYPKMHTTCADCFGQFSQCGRDNCMSAWACIKSFGKSRDCEICGWTNCGNALEACLGFDRSYIPRSYKP